MADYWPDLSQPNFLDVLYAIHNLHAKVDPELVYFGYTTVMPGMELPLLDGENSYGEVDGRYPSSAKLEDPGLFRVLEDTPKEHILPITSPGCALKGTSPFKKESGSLRRQSPNVSLRRRANRHLEVARRVLNGQLESFLTLPLPKNWRELLLKERDINVAKRVFCYWERRVAGPDGEIDTLFPESQFGGTESDVKQRERARCQRQRELVRRFRQMGVEDQAQILKRWFREVVTEQDWSAYWTDMYEEGRLSEEDEIAIEMEMEHQWEMEKGERASSRGWVSSMPVGIEKVTRHVKRWFRLQETCRRDVIDAERREGAEVVCREDR